MGVEEGREGPPGRLTKLAAQAKKVQPAFQSVRTECRLHDNMNEWLQNGLAILEEHYQGALRRASREVVNSPGLEWKEAWQVAVKWTRRRYKRLREDTVRRAWRLVKTLMSKRKPEEEAGEGTSGGLETQAEPEIPQEQDQQGQKEMGAVPMEVDQPMGAASLAIPTVQEETEEVQNPLGGGQKTPRARKGLGPSTLPTLPAPDPFSASREQHCCYIVEQHSD